MFKKISIIAFMFCLVLSRISQSISPLLIGGVSGLGACVCGYMSFPKKEKRTYYENGRVKTTNVASRERFFGQIKTNIGPNGNIESISFESDRLPWFIGFVGFSAVTLAMIFNGNKILKSLKINKNHK